MNPQEDTIAAIATPIGSGGIGVIRVSGTEAVNAASCVFSGSDPHAFLPNTAHHGTLIHPGTRDEIDDVILTFFRAPRSYTGEDIVEISCHGGISTVKAALNAVLDAGTRLAEPGEFTRRAFLNGKIDLAQAEAVNDLIRSSTDEARKVALRQLDGKLSDRISDINHGILGVIAAVEASIDFPEDVPEPDMEWVRSEVEKAHGEIEKLIASFGRGRIYREGLRVVIAGRVNVGKSSLLNALLRHARAIVTPIPGTTRDVIEENLEIHGIPIVAIDTAGLRDTSDPIERIGVELSHRSIESADLVLLVLDASTELNEEDTALLEKVKSRPVIVVMNKVDLLNTPSPWPSPARGEGDNEGTLCSSLSTLRCISTSASTGQGIDVLEDEITRAVGELGMSGESVSVSNIRHKRALESAAESLLHVLDTIDRNEPIDLISGDLAAARNSLGLITGETASEDLLDRIFSEFCIGK